MKMLVLALVLAAPTASAQTTWFVADVAQQGDGTSFGSPYNSIQYAIDQPTTVDGDTLQVAGGTYVENIDLGGKSIALVGSSHPLSPSIIDGSSQFASTVRIASGEGPGTRLAWLTIMGGNQPEGGGVYCAGAVVQIEDCMILQNTADVGGGVFAGASDISIDRTVISGNYALDHSGGVRLSNCGSVLTDVTISGNVVSLCYYPSQCGNGGDYGGGSIGGGTVSLVRCTISGNQADGVGGISIGTSDTAITDSQVIGNTSLWRVGGMGLSGPAIVEGTTIASNYVWEEGFGGGCTASGQVEFYDCRIEDNEVYGIWPSWGGGLHTWASGPTATRCVISGNYAGNYAGGVSGPFLLTNCILSANSVNNPISAGAAAGFAGYVPDLPVLVNCIAFGNDGQALADGVVANYCLIEGGWPGTGNIDADPQFLVGTYNLLSSSPCIDAGDPASPLDLDGSIADMGAFSFSDCNANGVVDSQDIANGTEPDANGNGILDQCECRAANYCVAETNSTGSGASIASGGSLSVSVNDLVLVASNLPTNEFGIFYYGQGQTQSPFGDGSRCVFGTLTRLLPPANSGALGVAAYAVDNTNPAHDPLGQITPATTLHFQFWYRDPTGGPAGFNLTDGLSLTFCP